MSDRMRTINKEQGGLPIRIKEVHAGGRRLNPIMAAVGLFILCEIGMLTAFLMEEAEEAGYDGLEEYVYDFLINLF